jgi:hypothetical protein
MNVLRRHASNMIATVVVTLCCLWYLRTNVLRNIPGLAALSDFSQYYRAGRAILNGRSPFDNPFWLHPPLAAFLVAPFALTDYLTARWILFLLSNACLLVAAWLLWRAIGRGRIALSAIACVWAFGGAAGESLSLGQIGPLLVLVLVFAYTRHSAPQGVAVGLGFALKYIPGLLAVPLILHRSRRALAAFAVTIAFAVLVPWAVLISFFPGAKTPITGTYLMGTPSVLSWSIPSLVLRILDPPRRGGPLPDDWVYGNVAANLHLPPSRQLISALTAAAVLGAGIVALTLVCRGRLTSAQLPWAMAGLTSLSLAAAPVCWTHYEILQYPGLAMLLAACIEQRDWPATAWTAACFAFLYPVPVAVLTAYYNQHGWTAASPPTLYFWTSVTPLACSGIFVLTLRKVRGSCADRTNRSV